MATLGKYDSLKQTNKKTPLNITLTLKARNYIPGHFSQGNENFCLHKNLCTVLIAASIARNWRLKCHSMDEELHKPWYHGLWTTAREQKGAAVGTHSEDGTQGRQAELKELISKRYI